MTQEFQWTDELVKEFIETCRRRRHISDMDIIGMDIEDFKKSKQKQPLFKTDDGVDIYEGDMYWFVYPQFTIGSIYKASSRVEGTLATFSTKQLATQWIAHNSPILSLGDVYNAAKNNFRGSLEVSVVDLKRTVANKLNLQIHEI